LSLEGKNIQLLKSTPIPYLSISAAKILFNILLTVPMITLSHGIVTIVFDFPFLESLLTWVLFVLLSSFFSVFFHWINVLLPRFDFQQDVEVVKQSLAALVAVLSGFALTALLATSYIVWLGQVEAIIRLLLLIGLILFGLLILTSTLKRLANRFYEGFKV
jgi:ABC-2 type transport system permease protein